LPVSAPRSVSSRTFIFRLALMVLDFGRVINLTQPDLTQGSGRALGPRESGDVRGQGPTESPAFPPRAGFRVSLRAGMPRRSTDSLSGTGSLTSGCHSRLVVVAPHPRPLWAKSAPLHEGSLAP
jgi:hypothetical protein